MEYWNDGIMKEHEEPVQIVQVVQIARTVNRYLLTVKAVNHYSLSDNRWTQCPELRLTVHG